VQIILLHPSKTVGCSCTPSSDVTGFVRHLRNCIDCSYTGIAAFNIDVNIVLYRMHYESSTAVSAVPYIFTTLSLEAMLVLIY